MEAVVDAFTASVQYARSIERAGAALSSLKPVVESVKALHELAPQLGQEVDLVVSYLALAAEALQHAGESLHAEQDAVMARIRDEASA